MKFKRLDTLRFSKGSLFIVTKVLNGKYILKSVNTKKRYVITQKQIEKEFYKLE